MLGHLHIHPGLYAACGPWVGRTICTCGVSNWIEAGASLQRTVKAKVEGIS